MLAGIAIVIMQGYLLTSGFLSGVWSVLAPILAGAILFGAFCAFARWDGRSLSSYGLSLPRPIVPALALAASLVVIYGIALMEPGFSYGFYRMARPSPMAAGIVLLYAPVAALSQEAVFRGYVCGRLLTPGRFAMAVYPSAGLFAVASTNLPVLFAISPAVGAESLLLTTVPVFALGIVLAVYYYRSGRNLLGPVAFRTGTFLWTVFFPLAAVPAPWVVVFISELLAYAMVFLFVFVSLQEPKFLARKYLGERFGPKHDRFLLRMRRGHQTRRSIAVLLCLGVSAIAVTAAMVVGLGTLHPFLAIESGSMAPTFVRGDLVVIQHVPASEIGVGTIVAYSTTCLPSPVVHRVVAVSTTPNGPVYTTKGDANPTPDQCPVPYSSVLGRVVLIVPLIGFFVLYPQFTIALLILAIVLVVLLSSEVPSRFPRQRSGW
jgi:signal peptidase